MSKGFTFKGVNYDSAEEYYFECCLNELLKAKYIKSFKRQPFTMPITEGFSIPYRETVQLKTKVKTVSKEQIILRPSSYTPDFFIVWQDKAMDIFFQDILCMKKITTPFIATTDGNAYYSIVECKPAFDRNNMTRLFKINQKFIWDKYEKYVNLIVVTDFFEKVFTPAEYLKTVTGKPRKLKFSPITLKEWTTLS